MFDEDCDPHSQEVDLELLDELLSLTPTQRVRRHERLLESMQLLREAGIRLYGFDPRVPEEDE
jgi:hypothetical protein